MEKLSLIIRADNMGAYKARNVVRQILRKCKDITAPNVDINNIALRDLKYHGKRLAGASSAGIHGSYDSAANEYLRREIILYFA